MTNTANKETKTLRQRTREAIQAEVREAALTLFVERGFDATTVEDIAAAAGISVRSIFRYFETKEDILVGESIPFGRYVRDALIGRPAAEPIWTALRHAFDPMMTAVKSDRSRSLNMMRVIMSTASLRASHFEKHLAWEALLIPHVQARLSTEEAPTLRAKALTHLALACLDIALAEWVASGGERELASFLDESFGQAASIGATKHTA